MSNFAYLTDADNKVSGATLSASSADSTYVANNAKALPIAKPWRTTGDTDEGVVIDLLSAQSIDFVALVNHNISAGATITVSAGTTSACSDYGPTTMTSRLLDAFLYLPATQSYRYWYVRVQDASNPDGYIQIGYIMLGNATTAAFNFAYGWSRVRMWENVRLYTEYGVPLIAELFNQRRWALQWNNLSSTDMDSLVAIVDACKRDLTPLFWIPDAAVNDGYFGRWTTDLPVANNFNRYSSQIEFTEESRGRDF